MKFIVFVPGIMGSSLNRPDGSEIWPPTALEATATGYKRIVDLVRNDLQTGRVIRSVCIDFYGSILDSLASSAKTLGGQLVEHAYDWRRDLSTLAAELGAKLDQLVTTHGPNTEITLVCHSMGGLIARGWLEQPRPNQTPGIHATKLTVLLAVPHEGAPLAFARAIGVGGASVGMSADDQRRLSGLPGFPAAYQLFPPAITTPIWRLDGPVPFSGTSLFDSALIGAQGINPQNLEAATAFARLLDLNRRPATCRYFAIASATHKTVIRFDERVGVISMVAVPGTGDGTVPVRSAAALPVQTAYVDADHVGVAQHANSHDLIAMLLGARPPEAVAASLADRDAQPALSISPQVVGSSESYEIVVLPGSTAPLAGSIAIEKENAGGAFAPAATIPIQIASPLITKVAMDGPTLSPGRYRLRLISGANNLAEADLVVMQQALD